LRCDFATLEPFAEASVSLNVRASVDGNFTAKVKVVAANDSNSANDARDVAMAINGAAVSASNGPQGGGGRVEWLALAFLALLLLRKPGLLAALRRSEP
jgi:hypothetical protein